MRADIRVVKDIPQTLLKTSKRGKPTIYGTGDTELQAIQKVQDEIAELDYREYA